MNNKKIKIKNLKLPWVIAIIICAFLFFSLLIPSETISKSKQIAFEIINKISLMKDLADQC